MTTALPSVTIEEITPEKATEFLTKNIKNRNKKNGKIAKYARDMKAGNWKLTGEAIKFDTLGNMSDGQNRCYAVIQSGVTITSMVVRGVDEDAMTVMDSGAPRNPGDSLTLAGFKNGKDLAAVVNVHKAWVTGRLKNAMAARPTDTSVTGSEAIDYVEARPSLEAAVVFALSVRRSLPVPIGAIATAFEELTAIDFDQAVDFFDKIRDFRTDGAGDPVAALLKRVSSDKSTSRSILPSTALFYIFRSWNAYRAGEKLSKFQIGSKDAGWAIIPEPK